MDFKPDIEVMGVLKDINDYRAMQAIQAAIRKGLLPKLRTTAVYVRCADCGGRATHYIPKSNTKPLDVLAICSNCRRSRGFGKRLRVVGVSPQATRIRNMIERLGGPQGVADRLKISYQAVYDWHMKGKIPLRRVIVFAELANVSPSDIDPEHYPRKKNG